MNVANLDEDISSFRVAERIEKSLNYSFSTGLN